MIIMVFMMTFKAIKKKLHKANINPEIIQFSENEIFSFNEKKIINYYKCGE